MLILGASPKGLWTPVSTQFCFTCRLSPEGRREMILNRNKVARLPKGLGETCRTHFATSTFVLTLFPVIKCPVKSKGREKGVSLAHNPRSHPALQGSLGSWTWKQHVMQTHRRKQTVMNEDSHTCAQPACSLSCNPGSPASGMDVTHGA